MVAKYRHAVLYGTVPSIGSTKKLADLISFTEISGVEITDYSQAITQEHRVNISALIWNPDIDLTIQDMGYFSIITESFSF